MAASLSSILVLPLFVADRRFACISLQGRIAGGADADNGITVDEPLLMCKVCLNYLFQLVSFFALLFNTYAYLF
jgi:hypothetical protein